MSLSLALQYVAVALIVAASAVVVLKKQFPAALRGLRIACAMPLVREGRPAWMCALGRRLAPVPTAKAAGCDGCDSCGSP